MLSRLVPYWRPARGATFGGLALLALAGALELLLPWPVKWLVDCVFGSQPAPAWMTSIAGDGASKTTLILLVAAAVLLIGVAHKLTFMVSHYLLIRAGLKLVRNLRCAVIDHLHRLSLRYHDRAKVGDLVYRALYDSYAAQSLLSQIVAPVFSGILVLAGIVIVMARVDLGLTLIAAVAIPAIAGTVWAFGRLLERRSKNFHERESDLFGVLQESLVSIRAVQAFSQETASSRKIGDGAARSESGNRHLAVAQLGFSATVGFVMASCTALAVYAGARRVEAGKLSVGDVLVFLSYLGMLYNPISAFAQSSGLLQSVRTQLKRVFEILGTDSAVRDKVGATAPAARATGKVEFRDLRFAYNDDASDPAGVRDVLRGIDATVEPGTTVAVVGPTGSGKSTLASLLMRFYDATAGGILLDGRDVRDLPLKWLRSQVTLVMQDPVLFAGTIADNIAFGREGATRDDIERAATLAQAHDFIAALPDGYDTLLGERGVNLSGGQRQRLSVARGFLRDAPVLVLDEPTSSLDGRTESAVVESIRALARGRTTFVIAHRMSTVRIADVIWVMDDGRLVERGTHDQLYAGDTLYRRLCASYFDSKSETESSEEILA